MTDPTRPMGQRQPVGQTQPMGQPPIGQPPMGPAQPVQHPPAAWRQPAGQAPPPPGVPAYQVQQRPPRPPGRPAVTAVRIVAAAITAVLVAVGATSAASWFFVRRETAVRTFTAVPTKVNISTDIGDIDVRAAAPGEETRLVVRIQKTFARPEWSAAVTGGTLDIRASCTDSIAIGYNACDVDFDLVMPAAAALEVSSNTGDVDVRGVQNGLTVETNTGDIRAVDLRGDLRVESDVGEVDGIRLTSGTTDVENNTGDVKLRYAAPPTVVDVRTDTGDIDVWVPDDATSYRVSTPQNNTSDFTVDVPMSSAATRVITIETDVGDGRVSVDS